MRTLVRGMPLLLLLAAYAAPGFGQTYLENAFNVNVTVTATWTDTGVQVTAGDSLFIRAQGNMSDGASGWAGWFGPDGLIAGQSGGCADCPLPGYPPGALIARIGTGSPFYVGSFGSFSCNGAGVLYLGVNDNAPASYVGTLRAFVWGGTAVPPPPVVNCDAGSPASALYIGSVSGDTGSDLLSYSGKGAKWLRVSLVEDDFSMCKYLSAMITLVVPEGTDYDLYVYCDAAYTLAGSSTNAGSATEWVGVSWDEGSPPFCLGDASGSVWIRVSCVSVPVNSNWQLQVWGNQYVEPFTCSPR